MTGRTGRTGGATARRAGRTGDTAETRRTSRGARAEALDLYTVVAGPQVVPGPLGNVDEFVHGSSSPDAVVSRFHAYAPTTASDERRRPQLPLLEDLALLGHHHN